MPIFFFTIDQFALRYVLSQCFRRPTNSLTFQALSLFRLRSIRHRWYQKCRCHSACIAKPRLSIGQGYRQPLPLSIPSFKLTQRLLMYLSATLFGFKREHHCWSFITSRKQLLSSAHFHVQQTATIVKVEATTVIAL